MKKEEKIVNMAYKDTMSFLLNDTEKWAKKECCGSFISYGLLNAVFEVLFSLAPSKEDAMEIIQMSLCNFMDDENQPPYQEYDPNVDAEVEWNEGRAIREYEKNNGE